VKGKSKSLKLYKVRKGVSDDIWFNTKKYWNIKRKKYGL
jgi:hypothetical protein